MVEEILVRGQLLGGHLLQVEMLCVIMSRGKAFEVRVESLGQPDLAELIPGNNGHKIALIVIVLNGLGYLWDDFHPVCGHQLRVGVVVKV